MNKRITELTPSQEQLLSVYRDKWLSIGLQTSATMDKVRIKKAIELVYKCGGLPPPAIYIYLDNPLHGCIGANLLEIWNQVGNQIRDQVRNQVEEQIRDQVVNQIRDLVRNQLEDQVEDQLENQIWNRVENQIWTQVRNQIWTQVKNQVENQVKNQVVNQVEGQVINQVLTQLEGQIRDQVLTQLEGQVINQVRNQVRNQIRGQVESQVRDQVRNQINRCGYGAQDANWLAFYDYLWNVLDLKQCEKMEGLLELSKCAGWWWPFEGAVIITPGPSHLVRDDEHRLHSDIGPALEYPGDFKIHAWHGVRIPSEWIEDKDKLDPRTALQWENQEQRRALCEIIGWDKVLDTLECKVIHTDDTGELIETNQIDDGDVVARFVKVQDPSTGRRYALRVPPGVETARGAVAWTFWIDEKDYNPKEHT